MKKTYIFVAGLCFEIIEKIDDCPVCGGKHPKK